MNNVLNIKWGLFLGSFWRHPICWFKDLIVYFKRLHFLLKHGYSPVCQWEYAAAILELSEQTFTFLRNKRVGNIPFEGGNEETYERMNDEFYDKLLEDIKIMRDYDYLFEDPEKMAAAKKHFFSEIEKYFYHLWD